MSDTKDSALEYVHASNNENENCVFFVIFSIYFFFQELTLALKHSSNTLLIRVNYNMAVEIYVVHAECFYSVFYMIRSPAT